MKIDKHLSWKKIFLLIFILNIGWSNSNTFLYARPTKKAKRARKRVSRPRKKKQPIRRRRARRTIRRRQAPQFSSRQIKFSQTISKFFAPSFLEKNPHYVVWTAKTAIPFTELILSWNALRPSEGKLTFWINVQHHGNRWSGWQRLAEWGAHTQRTFINRRNPYVHTKHVRVEMQKKASGQAFKVKVAFSGGAESTNLKALFACHSNLRKFGLSKPATAKPSVFVEGVPRQSQKVLDHPRANDLCSPTSTSMIVNYFMGKMYGFKCPRMHDYVIDFADKAHDKGMANIYGNWLLNVAQAFDASNGDVFYRVERLNSFNDLYHYLAKKIPVVVSVRKLVGGASPYRYGHHIVVVGWNREKQSVVCIDPAFRQKKSTLKLYKIWHFLRAWARSTNLSYIPLPKSELWNWLKF